MSNPDNNQREHAQDPESAIPDPVTGSTENATGADQAAENRETESPG
jgi:hypothetical protein